MLIYIASPYSIGNQADNVRQQVLVANKLLDMGYIPFCPCLMHLWHLITPKPQQDWINIGLAFLPRCDALLRLEGDSVGADLEVEEAKRLGLPIYYSVSSI